MAATSGLATAMASMSPAIVARGHGHGPTASRDRRSMSTTMTRERLWLPAAGWSERSAASTRSKAASRNSSRQLFGSNRSAASSTASVTAPAATGTCCMRNDGVIRRFSGRRERAADSRVQAGAGAAPRRAIMVPWPARTRTVVPAAETATLPRTTNTPKPPAVGPAKNCVPRTAIRPKEDRICICAGALAAGRSNRIGPD